MARGLGHAWRRTACSRAYGRGWDYEHVAPSPVPIPTFYPAPCRSPYKKFKVPPINYMMGQYNDAVQKASTVPLSLPLPSPSPCNLAPPAPSRVPTYAQSFLLRDCPPVESQPTSGGPRWTSMESLPVSALVDGPSHRCIVSHVLTVSVGLGCSTGVLLRMHRRKPRPATFPAPRRMPIPPQIMNAHGIPMLAFCPDLCKCDGYTDQVRSRNPLSRGAGCVEGSPDFAQ